MKNKILAVQIYEAKPNKLFSEEQTAWIRFLRYNKPIKCAECGKKTKKLWTALSEFVAYSMVSLTMETSCKIHLPLTPVCDDHPLGLPERNRGQNNDNN
jgi:hypothetical protein